MEISKHWRLRGARLNPDFEKVAALQKEYDYNLARAMQVASQPEKKDLQIGAMVVVSDGDRIFLTRDQAKKEMTGYMAEPVVVGGENVFSFPAGAWERGEDLPQTVVREVSEEVGVNVDASQLQLITDNPFGVSQFEREPGTVQQFAVMVYQLEVGENQALRTSLDQVVERGDGVWLSGKNLAEMTHLPDDGFEGRIDLRQELWVRPQTAVAAMLYLGGIGEQDIQAMNRNLISQTKQLAAEQQLERRNGVFDDNSGKVDASAFLQVQAILGMQT